MPLAQPPPRRSTPCGAYRGATFRQREFQPCRPRMRLSLALSFGGPQNPNAAMRFGLYVETGSRQRRSRLVRFNRLGGHPLACARAMLECPILRPSVAQVVRPLAGSMACHSRINPVRGLVACPKRTNRYALTSTATGVNFSGGWWLPRSGLSRTARPCVPVHLPGGCRCTETPACRRI